MTMACTFANLCVEDPSENPYPDRFKSCRGDLNKVQDCQDDIDNEHGERYILLVRSGYINRYERSKLKDKFIICDNHRKIFGRGFINELRQKKCLYCFGERGKIDKSKRKVSMDQSRTLIDKAGRIVPYGSTICVPCAIKIKEDIQEFEAVAAAVNEEEEEDEAMESQDMFGPSQSQGISESSQSDYQQQTPSFDSDTQSTSQSQPPLQSKDLSTLDLLVRLIQTIDPQFSKDKCMWRAKTPIDQLDERSKFKIMETGSLAIKAIISAMTHNEKDHGAFWKLLKESGCVEKRIGEKSKS